MKAHEEKMKEKRKQKFARLDKNELPFYMQMLMEHVESMHRRDLQLLEKMLAEAEKPENQDIFEIIEEDEK
jgi:hypothetical protein